MSDNIPIPTASHNKYVLGTNYILFGFAVFLFCGTFLPAYLSGAGSIEDAQGGIIGKILQYLMYLYILIAGAIYCRTVFRIFFSNPPLVLTIFIMLLSCLWSVDSGLTFYLVRLNFFMAVTAIFSLAILGYRGTMDVCAVLFCIIIWLCLCFALFVPEWGLHEGNWRGIFLSKNTTGAFACIATGLLMLKASSRETRYRLFWLLHAILGFVLLLFSASATSFAAFVVATLLLIIWIFLGKIRTYLLIFLPIVVILGFASVPIIKNYVMPVFLSSFQKDMSLTGRTDVWDAAFKVFLKNPILGYGHGAFWMGEGGEGRTPILLEDESVPAHSHNQWLETAIGMGIVGLLITSLLMFSALIRAAKISAAEEGDSIRHYGLFVVLAVTIIGFAEVPLFGFSITTFIVMLNYLSFSFLKIEKKEIHV